MTKAYQCDYCKSLILYRGNGVSFLKPSNAKNRGLMGILEKMDFCSYKCLAGWAMQQHECQNK